MPVSTVLLISPDASLIDSVAGIIPAISDLRLEVLADVAAATKRLDEGAAAVVLAHLPGDDDSEGVRRLLQAATARALPVPVVVVADRYHAAQALTLLRRGVVDYLGRPLDLNRLSYLLDMLTLRLRYEGRTAAAAVEEGLEVLGGTQPFLYARSSALGLMMKQVVRVAPQETTVLLGGETGTGKTRLARLIHDLSARREQPFLVVNCAALAANLIESEMFGHVRGAFTGADRDRPGKFTEVGGGTLLLDEIDALPVALQAKLLRAVEERVFEPVGSNRSVPMRARLIVASNRSLEQEVAAGHFRSDLYYRLNVVTFCLPPLREQPAVIGGMIDRFIAEFASRNGCGVRGITADARQALQTYSWPGNVRELRNVIERAVALCPGEVIHPGDLPAAVRAAVPASLSHAAVPVAQDTLVRAKEQAESTRIIQALQKHKNNRLRAAAELGISRMTLYKKLYRYGLLPAT
jgi:two-component system response regulator HydG